ncbi:MAG: PepSY domain-containing protein [Nannocystaceae bacterium]
MAGRRPLKASTQRSNRRLHRRIGVTIAAFAVVVASTGVVLSFRDQLKEPDPVATPVDTPPSIDALIARAEAIGGAAVTDVTLPSAPTEPYQLWIDDDDETVLFLDGRGELLGRRASKGGFTQLLFALHTGAIAGFVGVLLSALTGLSILALVVSGLVMARVRARPRPR